MFCSDLRPKIVLEGRHIVAERVVEEGTEVRLPLPAVITVVKDINHPVPLLPEN